MNLIKNNQKKYNEISALIHNKNFDRAEKELIVILKKDPKNFKFHYLLGILYGFKKKFDKAETHFKKVISLNSNDIRALYNLGVILKNNGKIDEAYTKFKKAFEIEPKYIEAILGIGKICDEKKNYSEAKKYYEKSLALDKNHKLANQLYGRLLMKLNQMEKGQYFNYKSSGVIRFAEKQFEII